MNPVEQAGWLETLCNISMKKETEKVPILFSLKIHHQYNYITSLYKLWIAQKISSIIKHGKLYTAQPLTYV